MPDETPADAPIETPADGPYESAEAPLEDVESAPHPAEAERDALQTEVDALRARVETLSKLEADLGDRMLRLQADFENFRRRTREDQAAAASRGKEQFVRALLPLLDNLDRALQHSEDTGLKLLARQLGDTLAGQGILVLAPDGEPFDAKLHEAIAKEHREGAESGTVVVVAEKGYMLDGKVLRPARVIVAG